MDNLFGNVSLFTIGNVSDKWDASDSDGLVSAADGVTIDEEETIRFSIVVHLDEQGQKTGQVSFIDSKKMTTHSLSNFVFELATLFPNLQQNKRAAIGRIYSELLHEAFYIPYDSTVGISSSGEGGEIRVDDEQLQLVAGSFLVCVSSYPSCSFSIDKESSYGVNLGDQEPDENGDYGLLIFRPDSASIEAEFKEAIKYLNNFSSAGLFMDLIEKWNTVSIENMDLAWKEVLNNLEKDDYPPSHIQAARIARFVLNDALLYQSIMDRIIHLSNTGFIDYTFGISHVAYEYLENFSKTQEEVTSLMETCISRLSIDDPSEVCSFIEEVGGRYSGLKLGNVDLAKHALTETLGRIQDSKIRTKFKIKGEKALKDLF